MTSPTTLLVLTPGGEDDLAAARGAQVAGDAGVDAEVLAWAPGPGLDRLAALAPAAAVGSLPSSGPAAVVERLLLRAGRHDAGYARRVRRLGLSSLRAREPEAVLLTSPRAAPLLRYVPASGPGPVVTLVPAGEMTAADPEPLSADDRALLLGRSGRFLVETEPTWERLLALGVGDERITWVGETLVDRLPTPPAPDALARQRAALGLPAAGPLVVGTGPLVWDGGADLFVRAGWILRSRLGQDAHLCWVGSGGTPLERSQLDHDIRAMGLAEHLLLTEDEAALDLADVIVLPSRRIDALPPYLPAASRSTAMVGFHAERLDRFVGEDAGVLVDFLDVAGLAAAVAGLLEDEGRRNDLAAAAGRRYADWHVGEARGAFLARVLRGSE